MAEHYDMTPAEKKILLDRAKRRQILREEFQKLSTDPFRHASAQGGTVFDASVQRFSAMKSSAWEYFKPTGRTTAYGFFGVFLPMAVYAYILKTDRDKKEAKFRRGEVAYKDRDNKFI